MLAEERACSRLSLRLDEEGFEPTRAMVSMVGKAFTVREVRGIETDAGFVVQTVGLLNPAPSAAEEQQVPTARH